MSASAAGTATSGSTPVPSQLVPVIGLTARPNGTDARTPSSGKRCMSTGGQLFARMLSRKRRSMASSSTCCSPFMASGGIGITRRCRSWLIDCRSSVSCWVNAGRASSLS
ncbi:MAG TPA: hypothetical protein VGG06_16150 [Thermoanaerobaculia bacterium]